MLLPRFSIRTMLLIATVVAVAAVFAGQAMGGRAWAVGLTSAVVSVPLALLLQAGFFSLGSSFARWLGPQEIIARTSRGGVERSAAPVLPEKKSRRRSARPEDAASGGTP